MTCRQFGPDLVICGYGQPLVRRHYWHCPNCGRRRQFVETFGGVWYASILTCVACGDSWCEGERGERPFARGWRKAAIRDAQRKWHVLAVSPREYRRQVRYQLDLSFPDNANRG